METTKKEKVAIICTMTLLMLILGVVFSVNNAYANTVEPAIPTYGLYCEDSELIKSGCVNFDFTDNELYSEWKGSKQSEYHVSATNFEVEFAIPFVSSAMNLPDIKVIVNGQQVEGSVWYGNSGYWADYDFDIDKIYSPILDDSIMGTLYTFVPDNDTITVSLKLNEWKSFIYETTLSYSSSASADGGRTWTLRETSPLHEYSFFIFGEPTECFFESSCGYKMQTITCKDFIDNQYKKFEEYYDHNGGVPIELFYSVVNRIMQEKTIINYHDLFSRSIDAYRVNAYKFKVMLESASVISYILPVDMQINYGYKPFVYYVEQRQIGNYPVTYSIKLREDVPYIIESSEATEKSSTIYTAVTSEDFGFYFSASENPIEIQPSEQPILNKTQLIVCIVCGIVCGVALIILGIYLCFVIRNKEKVN